jgi:excisionase family DNA binding protein
MSDRLLINIAEAAGLLGLTKTQLYQLTRERSRCRLPYVRLGKRLAFRRESLVAWIEANENGVRCENQSRIR